MATAGKDGQSGQGVDVNDPPNLVDLKSAGIVDPTRVTKEAVQNAVSIAGTSMTMGALVVDVPEKEPEAPAWRRHARRHGDDVGLGNINKIVNKLRTKRKL